MKDKQGCIERMKDKQGCIERMKDKQGWIERIGIQAWMQLSFSRFKSRYLTDNLYFL